MADEPTFETWADVAERVRTAKAGTMTALASYIGMQPSSLSRSVGRGTGDLTVALARKIERFFAGAPADEQPGIGEAAVLAWSGRALPAFGYVATPNDPDRFRFGPGQELDYFPLPAGLTLDARDYFVVIQPSSTMEPRIFPGETLIVRRNLPPARDAKAMIEFLDGTAVIKTYRGARSGRIFAEQYNPPETVDYEATTVKALHAVYLVL